MTTEWSTCCAACTRPGPYTWWSWRGRQFDNDAGWRIDLLLASPTLAATAVAGGVDREPSYEARVCDHSPVWADYAWPAPTHLDGQPSTALRV